MSDREVYPNAPVVLVAIEVRHPLAVPLTEAEVGDLKRHLASEVPLYSPATTLTLTASAGSGLSQEAKQWPRFMSRDKTLAVTFRNDAFSVETTRYGNYERLHKLAMLAAGARQMVAKVDGVDRIGIRYVNEIRVPEVESTGDWATWVHPAIAGPASLSLRSDISVKIWQGASVYSSSDGVEALVRHAPLEGYAVEPGGDLKRPTPPPGPFFLIDIDGYWVSTGETPQLEIGDLDDKLNKLHAMVKFLFESLITDKLRDEVLRHGE